MRVIAIIFMLLGSAACAFAADVYSISRSDVNRFVFPDPVTEVIFSEEKGLITKVVGNELYVKFPVTIEVMPETNEKSVRYSEQPSEVFVVCGKSTYNFILKPVATASKTYEIAPTNLSDVRELKGKDTEELLGALIGLAIENELPKGFKTTDINDRYKILRGESEVDVVYRKSSEGGGYVVREYHIYSPVEITVLPSELAGFKGVVNPLALSLTSEKFSGWSRAFVVELSR